MAIADTVRLFLEQSGVQYSVIPHPHTQSSRESAEVTRIPQGCLAKAVVLIDNLGYVMAVIPSDRHLRMDTLARRMHRKLALAGEDRIMTVFKDGVQENDHPLNLLPDTAEAQCDRIRVVTVLDGDRSTIAVSEFEALPDVREALVDRGGGPRGKNSGKT